MEVWHVGGLGLPKGSFDPSPNLVSHAFEAEQTQHIFFVGNDGEIYEIWWPIGGSSHEDAITTGAGAVGPITSHVFDQENTQHVFYQASNGHIFELAWTGGEQPNPRDLSDGNGAPLAFPSFLQPANPLTSHVFSDDLSQHVFYTSNQGHLIELWWRPSDVVPHVKDLNLRSGAPLPNLGPVASASHVFGNPQGNTQHVFYMSGGHIIELWWVAGDEDPKWRSLTAVATNKNNSKALFAICSPASHVFTADPDGPSQHVFYVAENGQLNSGPLIELRWHTTPEAPEWRNLSELSMAPLPVALPFASAVHSHVFDAAGIHTQHAFYLTDFGTRSLTGFVSELSWGSSDEAPTFVGLNVASGGAPDARLLAYRLTTHVFKAERTRHVFYQSVQGVKEHWHLVP
jgi:hypothetical protein